MYQPHRLNSSRLVLLLQQWTQPQGGSARQDVAEQLSQWLSTVDAVKLSRALHALESSQTPAVTTLGRGTVDVRALQASLQSTRAELTDLVTAKAAPAKPVRERADNTPVDSPDPEAVPRVHSAGALARHRPRRDFHPRGFERRRAAGETVPQPRDVGYLDAAGDRGEAGPVV